MFKVTEMQMVPPNVPNNIQEYLDNKLAEPWKYSELSVGRTINFAQINRELNSEKLHYLTLKADIITLYSELGGWEVIDRKGLELTFKPRGISRE